MKQFLLYIIFFMPYLSIAQSKEAYTKAGDKCLLMHDAFTAIQHYQAALEYDEEDAALHFKLSSAFLEVSDYSNALFQSEKTRSLTNNSSLKQEALYRSADLLKRMGRFDDAVQLVSVEHDSIAKHYLNNLQIAQSLAKDTAPFYLQQLPSSINTGSAEFSGMAIGDSLFYYTSHRFTSKTDNQKIYSKILCSKIKNDIYESGMPLPININQNETNNGNSSISPDGKWMVFTRCTYNDSNELICDLYEVAIKNEKFGTPKKLSINVAGATTTQPCITTDPINGYQLFFASNRAGGYGGKDLYRSTRSADGKYSPPKNLGSKINTSFNEITPFYNLNNDSLYFSSDREGGLGGYDIYQINLKDSNGVALPLKIPFNSGFNDLYFTSNYSVNPRTYLVSNRPPSEKINASACCNDLFEIKKKEPDTTSNKNKEQELSLLKLNRGLGDDRFQFNDSISLEKINELLRELLPLNLYFDNDYPDPKTRKTTTTTRYQQLVSDYLNRQNEYVLMQDDSIRTNGIVRFFNDSVYGNFQRLELVCAGLKKAISSEHNIVIKLKVEGSASSLATDAYNVNLSTRRISSIMNYWGEWNGGFITKAINDGLIIVDADPRGEQKAAGKVSDDANNQKLSVFSIEAANERKIVITDLSIEKK